MMSKTNGQKTYEYVFNRFSEKVLSGEYKLNDKLPTEREASEVLGVSRNSIREVMHMLEISGLIECVQGSGNYVRCDVQRYLTHYTNMIIALRGIRHTEVFKLRRGYEILALEQAIEIITPEELQEMRQVLSEMDRTFDTAESAKLDVRFHELLLLASHNRLLIMQSSLISDLTDLFIRNFHVEILQNRERADILRKSHWNILYALEMGDLQAAKEAMEIHMEVVNAQLLEYEEQENEG